MRAYPNDTIILANGDGSQLGVRITVEKMGPRTLARRTDVFAGKSEQIEVDESEIVAVRSPLPPCSDW